MKMTEAQKKYLEEIRKENEETAEKIKDTKYASLVGSLAELAGNLAASWLKFLDDEEEFKTRMLSDEPSRDVLRAMAITALNNAKEVESCGGYDKERIDNAIKLTIASTCIHLKEMESEKKSEQ